MNATTVAVDVAKNVFELAMADAQWKVVGSARLTRGQFERWFDNRAVSLVIMEACGSAHHWARELKSRGIEVRLLPAQYVRAYVKRNKTDAADARALLEAARASDMKAVRVKSVEQQALQALHRTRSAWMGTRTRRINALRGYCREFGLVVPLGAATGVAQMARYIADEHCALPALLRGTMRLMLEEIRLLEAREHSSGDRRVLGGISKRGDRYLRMLLTHGARAVLRAAVVAQRAGRALDRLKAWALEVQSRTNHNKAACALANKLARIAWAVWVKHEKYQAAAPTPAAQSN